MPGRRAYTLPLNNPDMIPAVHALHMQDDDVVLGLFIQGQARAYPWWLASNYHVVNDTVDDEPLLITLCEVCGGAAAFRPVVPDLPGLTLSFQISGVGLGTLEIADHQTHSKWRPFTGTSFAGPLQGRALDNHPLLMMTWREWKSRYPQSWVANGSPQLRQRPHGTECGRIGDPDLPSVFAATANLTDDRVGRHELVLGVLAKDTGKAYALPVVHLAPFPNLFVVRAGNESVLVVRETELGMTAFRLEGTQYAEAAVSLVSTNPLAFRTPDGWTWNAFGIGTAPGQPERKLPPARSYLTEWYEWVSHSRESEVIRPAEVLPKSP
jgi:hypothetical protein